VPQGSCLALRQAEQPDLVARPAELLNQAGGKDTLVIWMRKNQQDPGAGTYPGHCQRFNRFHPPSFAVRRICPCLSSCHHRKKGADPQKNMEKGQGGVFTPCAAGFIIGWWDFRSPGWW
jgi:hypothetical protein